MQNELHNIEQYLSRFRVKKPEANLRARVLAGSRAEWERKPSRGFIPAMQHTLWLKWAIAAGLLIMANVMDNSLTSRLLANNKTVDESCQNVPKNLDFLREINGFDVCRYARLARLARPERREIETWKSLKDRLDEYGGRSVL